jgi:hypothetical protein
MTASTAAVFNDEYAKFNWQATVVAGTGVNDQIALQQNIEDVRRLSGRTVTVSFWAWCISGTPKIGVELAQVFGSGGSPSAFVSVPAGAITISTTVTRYSVTIAVPSVSGKTFGTTAGTDYTGLFFWLSAGSSNAARASNIGLQSGTFLFWGVQLEIGTAATALEKPDPRYDLANCLRFYNLIPRVQLANWAGGAGSITVCCVTFPPMRAAPTVTVLNPNYGSCTGITVYAIASNEVVQAYLTGAVAGNAAWAQFDLVLSADL